MAVGGGGGFRGGNSSTSHSSAIATWVSSHYTAKTVDGVTVYDLTAPNEPRTVTVDPGEAATVRPGVARTRRPRPSGPAGSW